jgi:hypothetical protein
MTLCCMRVKWSEVAGKEKGPAEGESQPAEMIAELLACLLHVGCLRSFWPLDDFKFDRISFLQSAVAIACNCGVMYEDIGAVVAPDEAVTF